MPGKCDHQVFAEVLLMITAIELFQKKKKRHKLMLEKATGMIPG